MKKKPRFLIAHFSFYPNKIEILAYHNGLVLIWQAQSCANISIDSRISLHYNTS